MKRTAVGFLSGILLFVALFLASPPVWAEDLHADVTETAGGDPPPVYPVMRPDRETLERWIADYEKAPRISTRTFGRTLPPPRGSQSLLNHLQYTPSQRNQGSCGDCWVWAGTGIMGIDLSVNEGVLDRLSVQYINSCKSGDYACCGGNLADVRSFYTSNPQALPWSNSNAHFADASRGCGSGSSTVSCGSIATSPAYPIDSMSYSTITTRGVSQAAAIANIKAVLDANKAVWFAFYLANTPDWQAFYHFWGSQGETALWDPDPYCGHTWDEEEGAGHAVLCVGYNDDDLDSANHYWVILNSWGTASDGRPNGLFRMKMDINYSGVIDYGGYGLLALQWQTLNIDWGDVQPAAPCRVTYRYNDTVPSAFDDISSTGTALGLGDEDYASFSIPFTFRFYCDDYTSVTVGSNGALYFADDSLGYQNVCIPGTNSSGISSFIAPFWDDLNPSSAGEVYYQVKGDAPDRRLIVQWKGVPHYSSGDGASTFQAILYERSNEILFQYQDVDFGNAAYDDGASATVGVQRDETTGTGYSCNEAALSDGLSILFTPSGAGFLPGSVYLPLLLGN